MSGGMKYSSDGRKLTERFEGCRLSSYQDVKGVWTIGYGHTTNVRQGQTCTQQQADSWLVSDVSWAEASVNRLVKVPVTQEEFDALVDFTFNVGVGAFANSTMLRRLNVNDHGRAAAEFLKWGYAGGIEVAGLLARRAAEQQEFLSGRDNKEV